MPMPEHLDVGYNDDPLNKLVAKETVDMMAKDDEFSDLFRLMSEEADCVKISREMHIGLTTVKLKRKRFRAKYSGGKA